jgi:hypothetical protein
MRLVYGFASLLLTLGVLLYQPPMAVSNSGGAPAKANGSPISVETGIGLCTACHFGFEPNEGTGSVTIDAPETFVPGETITFTVSVDNTTPPAGTPKQGFQVSVENNDAALEHAGALVIVDDENTRFSDNEQNFVTHEPAGTQQSTWTVGWTAPTDAPESVTIYAAGNAADGSGNGGDYIYTTSVTLDRATTSAEGGAELLVARVDAVYPNPFVRTATVDYTLERGAAVTVTLYDGLGRVVRVLDDGTRGAGDHTVEVAADGLPAGVYFVEVRTPEAVTTRPLTLAR